MRRGPEAARRGWARRGLGLVLGLAAILVLAWGALAIRFASPWPGTPALVLAVAWTVVGLAVLLFVKPPARRAVVFAALLAVLFGWWSTIRPSNDRAWQADVARPPYAEVVGDRLTLHNVRSFDYRSETDFTEHWETRTYDLSRLEGVDLFLSYWGSPWIAHTIMSWRFAGGEHLAISIETRKEIGESYDPVAGFFRQYELYYVAADERDLVLLRTNHRGENVFLFPLRASPENARAVLLDYVASMNRLARTPEFYNAGTDNCTTTIRAHVLQAGGRMPWDYRILANGRAGELLYERGSIDTSRPFAEVKAAASIDARAKAADRDPDFSRRIREGIVVPPPLTATVPPPGRS